jgi:hypothetical protein
VLQMQFRLLKRHLATMVISNGDNRRVYIIRTKVIFLIRNIFIVYIKVYSILHDIDFCYYDVKYTISSMHRVRYDLILLTLFYKHNE